MANIKQIEKLKKDFEFHYQNIIATLKKTIRLMAEVDGVIESAGGWPVK